MTHSTLRTLRRAFLAGLIAGLAACNTVGGVGRDLQSGGEAITDTAQDAEQQL